jgi:EAL domain-containing protein (putative c-di-GMP-specific phosphodiesterase class I)
VRVAVNLSARLLQDIAVPARLRSLLEASEVSPSWLELEITESAMMLDPSRALRVLKEINALGVMIAVDDYGTGFSSLGYLRDLPVHALKLDKSFVMSMRNRSEDRVIVESTVQMAHALQLAVVAEGVETEWHAQFLAGIGYDYAQGYCYSPAIPAREFHEWVTRFNAAVPRDRAPGPARVVPFTRKVEK